TRCHPRTRCIERQGQALIEPIGAYKPSGEIRYHAEEIMGPLVGRASLRIADYLEQYPARPHQRAEIHA
ncbi:MAG: hypothetical protein ACI841_004295, partial [Planctomycetota bacterium]